MWLIIAVLVIFGVIFSIAAGGHYTDYTNCFRPYSIISDYSVTYSDDSVVKVSDVRIADKGEVVIDFDAISQGKTKMSIQINFIQPDGTPSYDENRSYSMMVNGVGMIINTSYDFIEIPNFTVVFFIFLAILLVVLIFMMSVFIGLWKKGDFGYQMVACFGSVIFIGVLLLFLLYKWLNGYMRYFGTFVAAFLDIGFEIFIAISPLMIVMSVLLAVSNIWLMKHEGYRPVNALGIVFGILWMGATAFVMSSNVIPVFGNFINSSIVQRIVLYLACYFGSMFIATAFCAFAAARFRPPYDRDYIIILGCGLRSDGTPMPLLKGRIDAALDFERKQFDATGKHAKFVPSGGQGADEVISESLSMSNYLMEQGVAQEQILLEDQSVNTMQNMQFSGEVIKKDAESFENAKIAFATTNYHIFRGYILARKNGFEAKGISAKTKKYFYPNAFLREFIGLLVDRKWMHIIFIILTLAVFVGLASIGSAM